MAGSDDENPLDDALDDIYFDALTIRVPPGSLLSPAYPAAVVAGNVETSQCVTDALYGALGTLDWIEQRPLADGAGAFDDLLNGRTAAPKIVLRP